MTTGFHKGTEDTEIRQSRWTVLGAVLFSVALNAAGQLLFKAARVAQPHASVAQLLRQPDTWCGLLIYGFSAICWLWVLARMQLSLAYPILSLTFPIVLGLSALFFAEAITPLRWVGVGVIVVGVSLLART
ncbi:MAG: 4-amino-4-deoxy-L-arabinose transferase [Candidatus Tectimicrobiota bacterium]